MSGRKGYAVLTDIAKDRCPDLLVERGHKLADRLSEGLTSHQPVDDYPILAATKVREPLPGAVPVPGEKYFLLPDATDLTVQGFAERSGLDVHGLVALPGVVVEPIVLGNPSHSYTDSELDRLQGGVFAKAIRIVPEYQARAQTIDTSIADHAAHIIPADGSEFYPIV